MTGLGLNAAEWPQQDRALWPRQREVMARIFRGDTREHWVARFAGRDACVTAVHTFAEAAASPELRARSTFVDWDGLTQPAPAPRLEASRATARPRSGWSSHTDEILRELRVDADEVTRLRARAIVT